MEKSTSKEPVTDISKVWFGNKPEDCPVKAKNAGIRRSQSHAMRLILSSLNRGDIKK
ncbi:MAG: hypothetical protein K9M03_01150 [Kiritimatiellales bacterium]|nr:hypothetical protein [Kiritimatiellales bacterium]